MNFPPPTPVPCTECPWRRESAPSFLGPHSPQEWRDLAHSEAPIACHQTITPDEHGEGDWEDPRIRQCRGAAIYRRNVVKTPRNPSDAARLPGVNPDRAHVFASSAEFLAHHEKQI